jgi:hypothetical protein
MQTRISAPSAQLVANFSHLEFRRPSIPGEGFAAVTDQLIAKFSG